MGDTNDANFIVEIAEEDEVVAMGRRPKARHSVALCVGERMFRNLACPCPKFGNEGARTIWIVSSDVPADSGEVAKRQRRVA